VFSPGLIPEHRQAVVGRVGLTGQHDVRPDATLLEVVQHSAQAPDRLILVLAGGCGHHRQVGVLLRPGDAGDHADRSHLDNEHPVLGGDAASGCPVPIGSRDRRSEGIRRTASRFTRLT
jgi:hypothetical protein